MMLFCRPRLSLRFLFGIITLVSIPLTIAAYWRVHQQRRFNAVSLIYENDGKITFRRHNGSIVVSDRGVFPTTNGLEEGYPQSVSLGSKQLDRRTLEALRVLPEITEVSIHSSDFSDSDVSYLNGFKQLIELDLGWTSITACGVEQLAKDHTMISILSLERTSLDDSAVEAILNFDSLQELNIRYTRISKKGISELIRKLPNCKVRFQVPAELSLDEK